MCIRCKTREKARQSLAFSPISKPRTHITYMLRQCTSIVYIFLMTFPVYVFSYIFDQPLDFGGCHGRDRMAVGFITTCAIGAYHH
jgi:hypothetical protein